MASSASPSLDVKYYLINKRKRNTTDIGTCMICSGEIQWRVKQLTSHKINKCTINEVEKRSWIARKNVTSGRASNVVVNHHHYSTEEEY